MPAAVESMVYVKETPWHGLGVRSENPLTAHEAYTLGGLDWQVELRLAKDEWGNSVAFANQEFGDDESMYFITRMDKAGQPGAQLGGVVTKEYQVIQNSEMFDIVNIITGDPNSRFETAGVLSKGQRVWALARLDQEVKIAGDVVMPYFLIANAHTGKHSLRCFATPVRVVCQNTLNAAVAGAKNSFKINHKGDTDAKIQAARTTLGLTRNYYTEFEKFSNDLLGIKVSDTQVTQLVNEILFPLEKDASKRSVTFAESARAAFHTALNAPDLENVRGTAWWLYNAGADYSDHLRIMRGVSENPRARLERAAERTFEDTLPKDRVLAFVTAL